jgi:hypothetical protein
MRAPRSPTVLRLLPAPFLSAPPIDVIEAVLDGALVAVVVGDGFEVAGAEFG